ncbi:hypothetical protein TKK_0003213 [Trichogramma kaykai]|uniref:Uncharacterized protein n=1 Tax=Trichogramma kaykai TaxID=54128 RepID=A0ABD2WSS1_9HYME
MAGSKSFFLLFSLLCCWTITEASNADHPLEKRSVGLTYPAPPTLLLIFGLGTPLQLEREATIVGAFAKFIYNLPIDASNYTRPLADQQPKTRSRWALYRALGRLLELRGLPEGRACVLRSICEAAHGPFARAAGGLLQPLLQTLLTPSSTINEPYDVHEDRDYVEAEALGRGQAADTAAAAQEAAAAAAADARCHALYPRCPVSILDAFTAVVAQKPERRRRRPTTAAPNDDSNGNYNNNNNNNSSSSNSTNDDSNVDYASSSSSPPGDTIATVPATTTIPFLEF